MTDPAMDPERTNSLPVLQVAQIPLEPVPRRWLIEGLWGARAVGFIGGPPKSCKSYLALELAVAVASGTPALGHHPVLEPGPSLIYLAEDSLWAVRERVAGLARYRQVDLGQLPLHVITAPRLRLDRPVDQQKLLETVRQLRPRLLLLDPLVRLHAVNENDATEVARLLSGLRELQRRLDVAVILVHHTRKFVPAGTQAGQGLRGSTDLHAFGDSNLYLRRVRDGLILSMEHRSAGAPDPVGLRLITDDEHAIHLEVSEPQAPKEHPHHSLTQGVEQALMDHPIMTRQALRQRLGVKNQTLGLTLEQLERQGRIQRSAEGWRLRQDRGVPVPTHIGSEGNGTRGGPESRLGG